MSRGVALPDKGAEGIHQIENKYVGSPDVVLRWALNEFDAFVQLGPEAFLAYRRLAHLARPNHDVWHVLGDP